MVVTIEKAITLELVWRSKYSFLSEAGVQAAHFIVWSITSLCFARVIGKLQARFLRRNLYTDVPQSSD